MSRDKGARFEREVVNLAIAAGLPARRTAPNQTQDGDTEFADVRIADLRVECKHHESIGDYIWRWLASNNALIIRKNRREPLAVIPLSTYLALLRYTIPDDAQP